MSQTDMSVWEGEPVYVRDTVFQPIDTPTAVDEVARRIRQAIVLGVLRDGDRLPAETEFAKRLGVGVMTVRAALSELRADGLLVTYRGRLGGSFVASSDKAVQSGSAALCAERLRENADVLAGLESHATRRATELATADERGALADLVAELDKAQQPRQISALNNRFHLTIASASRNRLLVSEISQRRAELHAAAFAVSGIRLPLLPGNEPHRDILEAMTLGAASGAADLMWRHHKATMDEILSSIG